MTIAPIVAMFGFAGLLSCSLVHAECVILPARQLLSDARNELVFSGTVAELGRSGEGGSRVVFDVERVWKGAVPNRFDLYVRDTTPEVPRFETGRKYLAIAKRLVDVRDREAVGLGGTEVVAFTPVQCSDVYALTDQLIRDLGPSQSPAASRTPAVADPAVPGPKLGSPDVVALGPGVRSPELIREVKPVYPRTAMSAGVQGMVVMDAVVLTDGTVGDVKITKSLDPDLDREAIRTVRQWRFKPATRDGTAVPVEVEIEMAFTLKAKPPGK
jgi:TonB family protein